MQEVKTLHKALITIKKLKKLLQQQKDYFEPIAIIGLSCRLPNASNKSAYWKLLCEQQNIISTKTLQRWELLKGTLENKLRNENFHYHGGFLEDISSFDAYFFGISPREAQYMDPQQRLLLEVVYEAVEDAGISVMSLAGSNTGVFASLYPSQFGKMQQINDNFDALLFSTGIASSIAANRISYLFDWHGPSMIIDTACSSSLVAIHTACLNLQNNLCDLALVCAANINLLPSIHLTLAKAQMLSPDGQCKTFDANADGYVPGEGIGAIVLKPLTKALQDKDQIYSIIIGSAINQDGKSNGLTAPNGNSQENLLFSAYKRANIAPEHISYIECHGSGTFLGDPIELQALGKIISKNRSPSNPCWIGSVKTNIGHLEPAAGIASIIKTALGIKYTKIPAHLNFKTPNPHINFDQYNFRIPTKLEDWPCYGSYRIAGISGFGFGGTNAHIVMRETTSEEREKISTSIYLGKKNNSEEIFTLSAKSLSSLNKLIEDWCIYLKNNLSLDIARICYNLHIRRDHYFYRLAIVTHSTEELYKDLCKFRDNIDCGLGNIYHNLSAKLATCSKVSEKDFLNERNCEIASAYCNQKNIDWNKYEEIRHLPHLELPLYSWDHKTYWPEQNSQSDIYTNKEDSLTNNSSSLFHALEGKQVSSDLSTKEFEFIYDSLTLPELSDTSNLIHAGFYIEMLAFIVKHISQKNIFSILELNFLNPLMVCETISLKVNVIIEIKHDNFFSFKVLSYHKNNGNKEQHASGTFTVENNKTVSIDSKEKIIHRCLQKNFIEDFYNKISLMGMPTNGSIRLTTKYWLGNNEIFCQFSRDKLISYNKNSFCLAFHPGVIDACIQPLFILLPEYINQPYVTTHIGNFNYSESTSLEFYLYARLTSINFLNNTIQGSWYLIDNNQKIVISCENITLKQLSNNNYLLDLMKNKRKSFANIPLQNTTITKNNITESLINNIATILAMPKADIPHDQALKELGMDSLMSLALQKSINQQWQINLYDLYDISNYSVKEIVEKFLTKQDEDFLLSDDTNVYQNHWIAYQDIQSAPKLRLFCFPYGGAGASIYRDWQPSFQKDIEVCPIQLPGRENRITEKPINRLEELLSLLVDNLKNEMEIPFAFFGHSFGGLISFELTRELRRRNLALPVHLFISAFSDPSSSQKLLDQLIINLHKEKLDILFTNDFPELIHLTEEQTSKLAKIFIEFGIFEHDYKDLNPAIIKSLMPIFIADVSIVKNYTYLDEVPLHLPITVFAGKKDIWAAPEVLTSWKKYTNHKFEIQTFDAGHLFINNNFIRKKLLKTMNKALSENLNT